MNASEAFQRSLKANARKKPDALELTRVMSAIEKATEKGSHHASFDSLDSEVEEYLRNKGYKIRDYSGDHNIGLEPYTVVSWDTWYNWFTSFMN